MPTGDTPARRRVRVRLALLGALVAFVPSVAIIAQPISALPDQTSSLRLSNHDLNHVVCQSGEIEDVKYSAEKAIAVERGGANAWIKFLVKEVDSEGIATRTFATEPSEFFITCNGAVYPLYAEPSDIPAQTVILVPGAIQRARANNELLGPLVEEERAVSITLSMLQDRIPASFSEVAPAARDLMLPTYPGLVLHERRRISVDGSGLSASEYLVRVAEAQQLDERTFLLSELGANIFTVTLDRTDLGAGDTARLIIVRRGGGQ